MYDYYLFPLPRASKWNRPIFDHSEVKIDLYQHYGKQLTLKITKKHISCNTDPLVPSFLQYAQCVMVKV